MILIGIYIIYIETLARIHAFKFILNFAIFINKFFNRNLIRGDVIEFEEFKLYDNNKFDGVDAELKLVFDQKVRNKGKKYIINDGDLLEFKYKKK
jgi:hypothetical protein